MTVSMYKRAHVPAVIACLLLCAAIGLRIWYVNANQLTIPEERYAMGEWVELDGAFLYEMQENTAGYSLRVTKAETMSCNEYQERFGKTEPAVDDDAPDHVLVLHYEVRNVGNDSGYIDMVTQWVLGERPDTFYRNENELWAVAEPTIKDIPVLRLVRDTEYATAVPFTNFTDPAYLESLGETYRSEIHDTRAQLIVTNAPVRKVIELEIDHD